MNVKTTIATLSLITLAFSNTALAAVNTSKSASNLEWKTQQDWQLPESPLDVVHSLDGNYVFILTKNRKVLIYTAQGKLKGTIPVNEGVNAIDISPRAEMLYLINSTEKSFSSLSIDFVYDINLSGSPTRGPAKAPVTIVLFTDFECPYCRKTEALINQVQERNSENVKIVFKNMPLQFHKFADPAARAALAADMQGKFWEFHDELFALEELNDTVFEDIAVKLGLDLEKWKKDKESSLVKRKINQDIEDARKAGVTGTPTFFINGKLLKNRNMQAFQQMIDAELRRKEE